MSGVINQRVSLAQGKGPDVELIVKGTPLYATYHTPAGFPAVYDDDLELFCYARLVDGRLQSTRVPVTERPPTGLDRGAREADGVRAERISERESHLSSSAEITEETGQ